ncbi:DUF4292 domain-containing protein [candidate division KSB1 bacterium]|nr:DUF4292 domain-containing protein [candidate division KSB1 bacterium]
MNNDDRLRSLMGWGKITIQNQQTAYYADAYVVFKKPDSLLLKIEAALGIDIGTIMVDSDSFHLYSPHQNTYYRGSTDSLAQSGLMNFDVTFDKLTHMLTGLYTGEDFDSGVLYSAEKKIVFESSFENLYFKYWIDPFWGAITRAEIRDSTNTPLLTQEFDRFINLSGVRIPRTIQLYWHKENQSFSMFYTNLLVNKKTRRRDFIVRIPNNAQKNILN